jgi:peptide/nickel transport system permease protein
MSGSSIPAYLLRRLAAAVAVLAAVSAVTFLFIHLAPGGPEQTVGGRFATPAQLATIRDEYGLDDPLPAQYLRFAGDAVRFDFGVSIATRQPVGRAISERMAITAPLLLISFALIVAIGVALGTLAAHRRGRVLDRLVVGASLVGASAPAFATAIVLLFVFGVELRWLPVFGDGEGFADRARHLVLPIATLTITGVAAMLKITRTRVEQMLQEDHVTFARACGLPRRTILTRSVLRGAGIQVVTQSGAILLALIGGVILVEVAFGLDGVGALFVEAISARDIPLVQAVSLLITAFIVLVNLGVDLLYFALDPRVRAGVEASRA